jgi:tRNA pseudouridine55 synthase
MNEVLNLYKQAGETPLECILRFKKDNPEYENVPMTYAGRLDPLAEGVLLVLAGEAVHRKDEFLNLKKEYEVEVLFGFETDTFDVLGIVNLHELTNLAIARFVNSCGSDVWKNNAQNNLKNFVGKNIFEYPQYSSKPVNGKPLFSLARSGELDGVEMPKREVEIYNLEILNWRKINSKDLLRDIIKIVNEVKGDFRQEEIISKWREVLEGADENFQIVKIKAEVSSGTYMRTLAHEWGKALGVPALAYHIVRTKIDSYGLAAEA